MITIEEMKEVLNICKSAGVSKFSYKEFSAEFLKQDTPMDLSSANLVKTLSESLPPDSELLFASAEDLIETKVNLSHNDGEA